MRGVRVGEASHPGPPDNDEWMAPESVIDALEADLTPPVPVVRGNRFAVLSESEVEIDEPMVRPRTVTSGTETEWE